VSVGTAAERTTGKILVGGGFWNLASNVIPQIYLVVTSIAAARFLGPSLFGRQSFIAFVVFGLVALLTGGFPSALTRYVGDAVGRGDRSALTGLLRWSWWLEGAAALVGGMTLLVIALAGATPQAAWIFAALTVAVLVMARVPASFLNGLQRWREPSVVGLAAYFAGTCVTVIVLAAGGGIAGMFAVEACTGLLVLVWNTRIARRFTPTGVSPRLARRDLNALVRYALLMSGSIVLTVIVYRRSEFLFLNHYSTNIQIALYSVAFSAAAALLALPQALAGVALPAIATLWAAGALDRIRAGYGRAVRLSLLVAFPLTAGALALGPESLRLIYGGGFGSVGPVLLILIIPMPLFAVVAFSNALLAAIGRLTFPLLVGLVAALVNIGLAFALIPDYGAKGAAIANSTAQITAGLPVLIYAQRLVKPTGLRFWPIARLAMAAALAGLAALGAFHLVGGAVGLCAGLALGALVFMFLASLLHVLLPEDARWLEDAIGTRFAPATLRRLARRWSPLQSGDRSAP